MDNSIDNLSISVTASAEGAIRMFDRLASSASNLRGASHGAAGGMEDMATGAKDAGMATHEAGVQSGKAERTTRSFGKAAKDAGDNAKKGSAGIGSFWQALRRIAYYRFIRAIIREIAEGFKEGITNLYHWSDAINGHFAKSMDRLATSSQYLKNSLGAMVSPLIETFVPILDVVIDKIVDVLNFFNMLVSAISGKETYTVAKKAAAVWDSSASKTKQSAKSVADEIKRTILGFDEINKLVKPNSSSGGGGSSSGSQQPNYNDMFEERPLTGIFKKLSDITSGWPDWLKWLLGVGTVAGAAWGITQIPKLLKKIFDGLKDLITLKIPNWLGNLFGGHGGGADGAGNYDVNVDLTKGDWELLDDLKNESALVKVGLQHWGWDNIEDWIGAVTTVGVGLKKWAWTSLPDWIGDSMYVRIGLFHWGWETIEDWIGRVVTVAVALKKWGWTDISSFVGNSVLVKVSLFHWGWDNIEDWIGEAVTIGVALKKWGWESIQEYIGSSVDIGVSLHKNAWTTISGWIGTRIDVFVGLAKYKWKSIGLWIGNKVTVGITLEKTGWQTIDSFIGTSVIVKISLLRNNWSTIANWIGTYVAVAISLFKSGWQSLSAFVGNWVDVYINLNRGNFWSLPDWLGDWVEVYIYLARGNFWSLSDWLGNSVTVSVNLRYAGGGVINVPTRSTSQLPSVTNNKPSGNYSSGGGLGRGRHANGGVITANSESWWQNVPKFAGGTNGFHGTMFLAGEAGPEIVGHVGGRTEVLNQSQLAATMYSAVRSAMSGVTISAAMYNASDYGKSYDENSEALLEMVRQNSEEIRAQNELLRQQNEYLRSINEKEFTAEVTTASITRAMNRTNRRAGTTVIPIGT